MTAAGGSTLRVAVDLGTSSTCVSAARDDADAQVVLVDGAPLMPSGVCFDGRSVFVGVEAERQSALDLSRYEPHPKSRVDEGTLLLGGAVLPVSHALAAVLRRVVDEARAGHGGRRVDQLVLTHPCDWGAVRTGVLWESATGLAAEVVCVPEPVAAAVAQGARLTPGAVLAVLDLGAGTTDVSVLLRTDGGFRVLHTRGDPGFGGADVDHALLEHLGRSVPGENQKEWASVVSGSGTAEGRRRRALLADVRGAKETLSRHAYADVPMPGAIPDAHVTRAELEDLILPRVRSVVELLAGALAACGALTPQGHSRAEVVLVGGSSRIPLLAQLIHRRLGVLPVATEQPETVVARGALLAVPAPVAPTGPPPPPPGGASEGRSRPRRRPRAVLVLALGGLGLTGAVAATLVLAGGDRTVQAQLAHLEVPDGWDEQSRGATASASEIVLAPGGSAQAPVRVRLVQQPLTAGSDLQAVASTLRDLIAAQDPSGDGSFSELREDTYADRVVLAYTQTRGEATTVDWYVVVDAELQLSVGCEHPDDDPDPVAQACEQAVRSVGARAG